MSSPKNYAAWLDAPNTPLRVGEAPLPRAGSGEIIVKNAAVAVAPLDNHMQDVGVFIKSFPMYFGSDIAGTVHEIGEGVTRFKVGDRVIGHAIGFVTGRAQDGAFANYTAILADKAAILPANISFTDGVVLPLALEASVTALCLQTPGQAMPGVPTPAPGLPQPSLDPVPSGKILVIYGGSSSVGLVATQIAVAAGVHVIAITSTKNANLSTSLGAKATFAYTSPSLVDDVVAAVQASDNTFVGILDSIANDKTFPHDLAILEQLGGGHLAASHPPPTDTPASVKAGMFWGVNDVATLMWTDFVTPALECGKLSCAPHAVVVGNGLQFVDIALKKLKDGVSATKLVVEL